jgi:hypothetical protein
LTLPTRDYYLRENDTVVVEALKKVVLNVVKLLLRVKDRGLEGSLCGSAEEL